MENKNRNSNQNAIRWADYPGEKLVLGCEVEIGGALVGGERKCERCDRKFNYESVKNMSSGVNIVDCPGCKSTIKYITERLNNK